MNKLILLFAAIIAALVLGTSCRSFNINELKPTGQNQKLLPFLEPKVDLFTLEGIIPGEYISNMKTEFPDSSQTTQIISQSISRTRYLSQNTKDIIALFEREVLGNISQPYGEKRGSIVCKVAAENRKTGYGMHGISMLTLGIVNLIGFPVSSEKSSIDIDVEIYNLNHTLIGRYNGVGIDKKYTALYYGYDTDSALRMSRVRAFKKAMANVKEQIATDNLRLQKELAKN